MPRCVIDNAQHNVNFFKKFDLTDYETLSYYKIRKEQWSRHIQFCLDAFLFSNPALPLLAAPHSLPFTGFSFFLDDRPFIVLTETKPSKRHIPVWARYSPLTMCQYERNQPDYRVSCPPSRMCSSARGQRGYYEVPVPEGACTQSSSRGGVQRKPTVAVLHRGAIVIEHAASLPVVSHATGDTAGDLVEVVAGEATVVVPSTFGVRIRQ